MANGEPWTTEEIEILDKLIGHHHSKQLMALFRRQCRMKFGDNYVHRSDYSIRNKALQIAGSIKPVMANFTITELANILAIDVNRIYGWKKAGHLKVKYNYAHTVVTKAALNELANNRPDLLACGHRSGLIELFGEDKTNWILTHEPHRKGGRPVKDPSGNLYQTIRQAAKAKGVTIGTISYYLKRPNNGWRYADNN